VSLIGVVKQRQGNIHDFVSQQNRLPPRGIPGQARNDEADAAVGQGDGGVGTEMTRGRDDKGTGGIGTICCGLKNKIALNPLARNHDCFLKK